MNIEELRNYCLQKRFVKETFPFDSVTIVYKVRDKAFLLTGLDDPELNFNVKCDPEKALELREKYPCVQPGYHMNKKHWNTIYVDGSVEDSLLIEWINHSYDLVLDKIPIAKKKKKVVVLKKVGGKRKK